MRSDEVHEPERRRRKARWALTNIPLDDPNASEPLAILDHLDILQQTARAFPHELLDLNVALDSVRVKRPWRRSQPVVRLR